MIHSFFFISSNGDVLIEKHWRGISPRSLCEYFWEEVNKYDSKEDMPPVIVTSKYYLISALREGNYLLATTTGETPPLVAIEFLHRVFDIFAEYFGDVEETTIKENFATCYQLLEEMVNPLPTTPLHRYFLEMIILSIVIYRDSFLFVIDGLWVSPYDGAKCIKSYDKTTVSIIKICCRGDWNIQCVRCITRWNYI